MKNWSDGSRKIAMLVNPTDDELPITAGIQQQLGSRRDIIYSGEGFIGENLPPAS